MLKIVVSNRFKKDLKLAHKRGCDMQLLNSIVTKLANEEPLPEKYKDHNLSGDYVGYRECHVQPDWLLIYKTYEEELVLLLYRTGSHSDLF